MVDGAAGGESMDQDQRREDWERGGRIGKGEGKRNGGKRAKGIRREEILEDE